MADEYVQDWPFIPDEAFLYFPSGEQIKIGDGEKQWRKIFQNGQKYDKFELQELQKLENKLNQKKIILDPWFDTPNKLRFLQANKFKISNTIESMEQTTKWRKAQFPISIDQQTTNMLNSGAFYFCGRDDKYRPIIVADIGKFNSDQVETIPKTLVLIMEFMVKNLLIEGQVENYILIMNLEQANFGLRNVIMKILSFTSNAYRGRLFASYILAMPTIIRWGWEGIVSKFVSENTLKKIKITGEKYHEDMWNHISKQTIQIQYGGIMANVKGPYWPPSQASLKFINPVKTKENKLIAPQKYRQLQREGRFSFRKINKKFIQQEKKNEKPQQTVPFVQKIKQQPKFQQIKKSNSGKSNEKQIQKKQPIDKSNDSSGLKGKNGFAFKTETSFIKDYNTIKTFFQTPQFLKICEISSH